MKNSNLTENVISNRIETIYTKRDFWTLMRCRINFKKRHIIYIKNNRYAW